VIIDDFTYFTTAVSIGNNVHIAPFVSSIGGSKSQLTIGDFSSIAAGVRFVCSSDNFKSGGLTNPTIPSKYKDEDNMVCDIVVNKHVIIGTNSVILQGLTLNEGCAVGAMSLVRQNLEPWWMYVGNPLKKVFLRDKHSVFTMEERYLEDTYER
jgi:acetyltransferase-like isoleucine patch superfamily enzyme